MKHSYKLQFLIVLFTTTFTFAQPFVNGVFVTNEGGFGAGNATLSFLSNTNVLQNNIFAAVNPGSSLGDTAQSMFFDGDNAYIIMNGSGTIKVVNRTSLELVTTITGLINPRYMTVYNNKIFVTCWGNPTNTTDDYVAVLNKSTNQPITTISVPEGPENIIVDNNQLYVSHKGGYGFGVFVSILEADLAILNGSLVVGEVPTSIQAVDGFLYVLCSGKPNFSGSESAGSLVKINLNTELVTVLYNFPLTLHPSNLKIVGQDVYYTINSNVYKTSLLNPELPATPLLSVTPQGVYGIYSFNVIDDILYVADAGDYTTAGKVYTYSTAGTLLNSFTVGVIPNGFYKADTDLLTANFENDLSITLFPNPTSDKFYLNTNEEPSISIYDLSGRIISNQKYKQNGIDISSLKPSVYLVAVELNNQKTVKYLTIK